MNATSTIIRLLASALLFLAAQTSRAVTLNWNTIAGTAADWTDGALSQSFEVDATNPGNDITITITPVGSAVFANTYPQTMNNSNPAVGNNDQNYLVLRTNSMVNATSGFTVTMTFNYARGVYANFTILDLDRDNSTGNQYIDRIEAISAQAAAGGTVPLTVVSGNTAQTSVTGSGTLAAQADGTGGTTGITDHSGDVSLDTNGKKVTSLTFKWSNPGPRFDIQLIALSNIVFFTTPEVGSSLGALCFCGGLAAFTRRRRQVVV